MAKEIISVGCNIKEEPMKNVDGMLVLKAEAFRGDENNEFTPIKLSMGVDLYLDILNDCKGVQDISLCFLVKESWEKIVKVGESEELTLYVENDFDLIIEENNQFKVYKTY